MQKLIAIGCLLVFSNLPILAYAADTHRKEFDIPSVPGLIDGDPNRSDIITPIVRDKEKAIILGKALFWEQAAGSDGMACASCHFHAGADSRIRNQINPGILHGNANFDPTGSGGTKSGPNYTLNQGDFPFVRFTNPAIRDDNPVFMTDDVVSSAGARSGKYIQSAANVQQDTCVREIDPIYNIIDDTGKHGTRLLPPRNTPTVINAVYNFRNFWDGRANNVFNGETAFGPRDPNAGVYLSQDGIVDGIKRSLQLLNSALASQAVVPAINPTEMSCSKRLFPDLGRKLLNRAPLRGQEVHPEDSVLAALRNIDGYGLNITYKKLVKAAFNPVYWQGDCNAKCGNPADHGLTDTLPYSLMEANFSMFWGLAIQLYESTLVSDQSRYDQGPDKLNAQELQGMTVFFSRGKCNTCHANTIFPDAPVPIDKSKQNPVNHMLMNNTSAALYDNWFYNIGVTPDDHDIGLGANDPFGNPLSFTGQYIKMLQGQSVPDNFQVDPCLFTVLVNTQDCTLPPSVTTRQAVAGAFKTPTLRNIWLTGPYMHNGGMSTLEQVMDFYQRGGNFRGPNLDPNIGILELANTDKAAVIAFLKTLTDPRVELEQAPFDHPSLTIPHGHPGDENTITQVQANMLLAKDRYKSIPAVGKTGRSATQKLKAFHEILPPAP